MLNRLIDFWSYLIESNRIRYLLVIKAVLLVVATAWVTPTVPLFDHLDVVPWLERYQAGELGWFDLFHPFGGHWHVAGYGLTALGWSFTGWDVRFDVAVGLLFGIWAAGWMFQLVRRWATPMPKGYQWAAIGVAVWCILSFDQMGNWFWGWQAGVFIAIWGLVMLLDALTQPVIGWRQWLMALAGFALAVYNFTTMIVLIPACVLLISLRLHEAIKMRLGPLLIWLAAGAGVIVHYFLQIYREYTANDVSLSFADWCVGVGHYALNYLASPVVRFADDLALPIVALSFGLLIWLLWPQFRASPRTRLSWQALALPLTLVLIGLGCAGVTAIGRIQYGPDHAFVSRYITFGNLYWIGWAIACLYGVWQREAMLSRAAKQALGVVAVLLFLLKLGNEAQVLNKHMLLGARYQEAADKIRANHPDLPDTVYQMIYYDAELARSHFTTLKAKKLSIFND